MLAAGSVFGILLGPVSPVLAAATVLWGSAYTHVPTVAAAGAAYLAVGAWRKIAGRAT